MNKYLIEHKVSSQVFKKGEAKHLTMGHKKRVALPWKMGRPRRKSGSRPIVNCIFHCLMLELFPNLIKWVDKEKRIFYILFKHKKSPDWTSEDLNFFKELDALSPTKREKYENEKDPDQSCKRRCKANLRKLQEDKIIEYTGKEAIDKCTKRLFYKFKKIPCNVGITENMKPLMNEMSHTLTIDENLPILKENNDGNRDSYKRYSDRHIDEAGKKNDEVMSAIEEMKCSRLGKEKNFNSGFPIDVEKKMIHSEVTNANEEMMCSQLRKEIAKKRPKNKELKNPSKKRKLTQVNEFIHAATFESNTNLPILEENHDGNWDLHELMKITQVYNINNLRLINENVKGIVDDNLFNEEFATMNLSSVAAYEHEMYEENETVSLPGKDREIMGNISPTSENSNGTGTFFLISSDGSSPETEFVLDETGAYQTIDVEMMQHLFSSNQGKDSNSFAVYMKDNEHINNNYLPCCEESFDIGPLLADMSDGGEFGTLRPEPLLSSGAMPSISNTMELEDFAENL